MVGRGELQIGFGFWFQWVLLNAAGWAIGMKGTM
jgi:hypothetical protein